MRALRKLHDIDVTGNILSRHKLWIIDGLATSKRRNCGGDLRDGGEYLGLR